MFLFMSPFVWMSIIWWCDYYNENKCISERHIEPLCSPVKLNNNFKQRANSFGNK